MFGFSDSNNSDNSSSSSNSNDIFNTKILFINFNNIIKTESSEPTSSKPKPTSTTSSKPKSSKPKSSKPSKPSKHSKPTSTTSSKPSKPSKPNVGRLPTNNPHVNTQNIYSGVLDRLRYIFDEYIKHSNTKPIECVPFFSYIAIQTLNNQNFNFMSRQNLMNQQDTGELILEFMNYINIYYGVETLIQITSIRKLNPKLIINKILNNRPFYSNILYYLFGIISTNRVDKIKHNNTKQETYTYDLQYMLELKFNNKSTINIDNINALFTKYIDTSLIPENTNVAQNNVATIKNVRRQDLQPIICGKYVIISLIHEKYINLNGVYVQQKIPIIITDITQDLVIDDKKYEFIGASEHMGQTTKSGHYVSYIKKTHKGNVNYYLYNDDIVTKIKRNEILKNNTTKTYRILIYKCKDDRFYMNNSKYTKPITKLFNVTETKLEIKRLSTIVNSKLIGSTNYGNTCYFNSLLVLLMHIPEFVYLILNYDTIPTLLTSINNR